MDDLTRLFTEVRVSREQVPRNGRRLWAHHRTTMFADNIGHYIDASAPCVSNVLLSLADSIIMDVDQRRTTQVSGDQILNDVITTMNTFELNGQKFELRFDQTDDGCTHSHFMSANDLQTRSRA